MSQQEFISILEDSLSGELPGQEIKSNVQYYRDYIETEKRKKSEQEVLAALGDPRLIARTIIDAYQLNHPGKHFTQAKYENYTDSYQQNQSYQDNTSQEYDNIKIKSMSARKMKLMGWLIGIGLILVLFLILGAVFWVGSVVLRIFVRFILPIIIIAIGIGWIRNQFRR